MIFYEYLFQSSKGRNAVMRFATKNNLVDYINLRIVDDTEKDKILSNIQTVDYERPRAIAQKILISYYDNAKERELRKSYNYFTDDVKNSMDFMKWTDQFDDVVNIKLYDINVASESSNSITLNYKVTATTSTGLTTDIDAHATIINGDKGWKITDITNENLHPSKNYPGNNRSASSSNNLKSMGLTLDQFVNRYNDALNGHTWNGIGTISNVQFGASDETGVKSQKILPLFLQELSPLLMN